MRRPIVLLPMLGLALAALAVGPAQAKHHNMGSSITEQCSYPAYARHHPNQCPAHALALKNSSKLGTDGSTTSSN